MTPKNKLLSLILFIGISLGFSFCKKEKEKDTRGYKCDNYECKLVEENADYLTLDDCKSECTPPVPTTGKINFDIKFWVNYSSSYTIRIRAAKSTDDLGNGLFSVEKDESGYFTGGPNEYSKQIQYAFESAELNKGTYYYSITITINQPSSGTTNQFKSDMVAVNGGQTTTVTYP